MHRPLGDLRREVARRDAYTGSTASRDGTSNKPVAVQSSNMDMAPDSRSGIDRHAFFAMSRSLVERQSMPSLDGERCIAVGGPRKLSVR